MEFMTIDKTRCLGILEDELGQMMEIRPDLRKQILDSASKSLDLSEVGPEIEQPDREPKPEVVIVDKNRDSYTSKAEIMEALGEMDIEYRKSMTKAELLDLLESA